MPVRSGPFYGWYILGMAMLGAMLNSGTSQMFFSIMLKPITEEFGWSRTALAGITTMGTFAAGFASPLAGRLADRYGPRLLAPLGAAVVGTAYLLLPTLSELWQFYVVFVTGRAVGGVALTGVVPNTALANWFRRMRGRVIGLVASCTPLGGGLLALVGQVLIDSQGWRTVYVALGVVTLAALVAPMALVMRRRPEDLGLLPDGEGVATHPAGGRARARPREEVSWTLGEAMRTPALWLITAASFLAVTANAGVSFHQVAYYTDVGIPPMSAVVSLAIYALAGALAVAFWGFLTERVSERDVGALVMLLAALVTLYILTVRTLPAAIVFAVLFGLTSRGEGALLNIILAQYFGRGSYGTISGFVHPFTMLGLGLGPFLASVGFDLMGSYDLVFMISAVLSAVAAVCLWLARKPVKGGA